MRKAGFFKFSLAEFPGERYPTGTDTNTCSFITDE